MYGACPAVERAKHRVLFLVVVVIYFFSKCLLTCTHLTFGSGTWINYGFRHALEICVVNEIEQNPTYANLARSFENAPFCNYTEKIEFSKVRYLYCSHSAQRYVRNYRCFFFLFFFLSKVLAKRTRKSTQVLDLRSNCVSFGHPLASTCIDLRVRLFKRRWVFSSEN